MLRENNTYFGVIPKSRTAKVVRSIIDIVARLPDSLGVQIDLCRGVIEWCREEKRTFLRQRVDARVSNIFAIYFYSLVLTFFCVVVMML